MSKLHELKEAARRSAADARAIIDKAAAEDREMTKAEHADVRALTAKGYELVDKIEAAKADEALNAFARDLNGGGSGFATSKSGRPWAAKVADRIQSTARDLRVKALTSGSIDVPNVVPPGVAALPDGPERLVDVLVNRQPLTGNTFTYLRQSVRTNNAAPVADFGTKPTSVFTFAEIEDRARVIAHLSEPIPERFFADHDQLIQVLDGEMHRGILDELEAQVIAGGGTGENFTGLLSVSGTVSQAFTTDILTTARKARTALRALGEVPTAWVFTPADAEAVDLLQDTTDQFVDPAAVDRIFGGLPRLISSNLPAGTAVLGDWTQASLFVREDIVLDADRSGTNFTKNQVTLRAEGRFGFAVHRPQAFVIVDTAA